MRSVDADLTRIFDFTKFYTNLKKDVVVNHLVEQGESKDAVMKALTYLGGNPEDLLKLAQLAKTDLPSIDYCVGLMDETLSPGETIDFSVLADALSRRYYDLEPEVVYVNEQLDKMPVRRWRDKYDSSALEVFVHNGYDPEIIDDIYDAVGSVERVYQTIGLAEENGLPLDAVRTILQVSSQSWDSLSPDSFYRALEYYCADETKYS